MARVKTFSREAVLEKAMAVFWEKGYEATSMQDLVVAMGIHRGSLYSTFQDKRHLFLAAIAHYRDTVMAAAIAPLQPPEAARAAVEAHFRHLAAQSADGSRGCLMTNAIVELAARDRAVADCLQTGWQRLEDAFYRALSRAQDRGELAADKDLRALARYLITCLQGLRVAGKMQPPAATLEETATLMLQALD